MIYDFKKQLQLGEKAEIVLDGYFSESFFISPVSMELQRQGIDRIYEKNHHEFRVEYKMDTIAHRTGNAFIETVSVDSHQKKGWAYTTKADFIFYYLSCVATVYVLKVEDLQKNLSTWVSTYKNTTADNGRYRTHGVLVPLSEIEKISKIIQLQKRAA